MKQPAAWEHLGPRRLESPPDRRVEEACARLFLTPDGEILLAFLRAKTKERVLPPAATDAELRDLEGGRRIVSMLENMIEQGRRLLTERAPS
jgi:hypothetical protein